VHLVILKNRIVDREKRKGDVPIPANLKEMLSEAQRQALPGIEYLGWEPWFLRKTMFQASELVMQNSRDGTTGILDVNGEMRIQDIKVREQESETQTPSIYNIYLY